MNAYTQQYQQNQVLTASPEQILVMLYDAAIRFTRQAMIGIEDGRTSVKADGVSRAMAIITEFSNTLDHDIGGQIAADLDALYSFMIRELNQATLNDDMDKLKVVEGLLTDLRQTWVEAIDIARNEGSTQQANSKPMIPDDYKPLTAAG